jgi:hypothetical protein
MLVSLSADDSTKIELASPDNADRIHGVVVDPNDAPVTISEENQTVFVATVGRYDVLLSDQNGPVQPGDYITVSNIQGVGMKADNRQSVAIGKALAVFDDSSSAVSTSDLATDEGGTQKVRIGRIAVDVGIGANPLADPKDASVPSFLRRAAEAIVNKQVNPLRIYLGILVLLVASATAASLLYAGVHSSMTAIGRNPLSKKSIMHGLIQIILASFMIFIVGLFGVYLILKL